MFLATSPQLQAKALERKLRPRQWKKARRCSPPYLPSLPLLVSSPLSVGSWRLPLPLHHSTDRRVGQVELACDVSGRVLLQRWRETGGRSLEGWHITGCHVSRRAAFAFFYLYWLKLTPYIYIFFWTTFASILQKFWSTGVLWPVSGTP